jgi:hypothetical protein
MAAISRRWPCASAMRATCSSRARNTMRYTPRTEVLRVWPKPVGMPARLSSSMTMCSSTWPHQVPSCRRCRKPPRSPTPQWCSTSAGSQVVRRSLKPGNGVEGWSSSSPGPARPPARAVGPDVGAAQVVDAQQLDVVDFCHGCGAVQGHRAGRTGSAIVRPVVRDGLCVLLLKGWRGEPFAPALRVSVKIPASAPRAALCRRRQRTQTYATSPFCGRLRCLFWPPRGRFAGHARSPRERAGRVTG